MRTLASYCSLLAIGLLVGGLLFLFIDSPNSVTHDGTASTASAAVDFRSLFIGLLLGLVLSNLSRIAWMDLPRRFVAWILAQEDNLFYGAVAAILLIVLIAL